MGGGLNRAAASRADMKRRDRSLADQRCAERLADLRARGGLLPVCSWCRRFRDGSGRWVQADCGSPEAAGVPVTHGLCPDCRRKHFPWRHEAA